MFLILIDVYSKWIEVYKLFIFIFEVIIEKFRQVFVIYGIFDVFVMDNGICFISYEFFCFILENGILYVKILLYYFVFNGLVEWVV